MHSIVIVNKDNEYMAFKYYANEYLNDFIATSTVSDDLKKFNRQEVSKMLGWLNESDRKRAEVYRKFSEATGNKHLLVSARIPKRAGDLQVVSQAL